MAVAPGSTCSHVLPPERPRLVNHVPVNELTDVIRIERIAFGDFIRESEPCHKFVRWRPVERSAEGPHTAEDTMVRRCLPFCAESNVGLGDVARTHHRKWPVVHPLEVGADEVDATNLNPVNDAVRAAPSRSGGPAAGVRPRIRRCSVVGRFFARRAAEPAVVAVFVVVLVVGRSDVMRCACGVVRRFRRGAKPASALRTLACTNAVSVRRYPPWCLARIGVRAGCRGRDGLIGRYSVRFKLEPDAQCPTE